MPTESNQPKFARQKREFVTLIRQALTDLLRSHDAPLPESAVRGWDERLEPYIKKLAVCDDPTPRRLTEMFGCEPGSTWAFLIQTLYYFDGLRGVADRIRAKRSSDADTQ